MILDDFIMLGTTVPEPNSDGRVFVCSAGLSPEFGKLVRIYPLARRNIPHRWGVYKVPLERNPKDSRDESFRLAGDRSVGIHEQINDGFELVRKAVPHADRIRLLSPYVIGSIKEANERSKAAKTPRERFSLAVIHPEQIDLRLEQNADSPDSPQLSLFDPAQFGKPIPQGAKRFAYIPRLRFRDELGWNDLMLRDWGAYEFQRKNSDSYFRQNLAGALHLSERSSLLVGNFNRHRTSWLVISVLNGIREAPTLFDALPDQRQNISDKIRLNVYQRDGWKCARCGSADKLTVDHKWPHARGGTGAIENLETLCPGCNMAKNDRVVA